MMGVFALIPKRYKEDVTVIRYSALDRSSEPITVASDVNCKISPSKDGVTVAEEGIPLMQLDYYALLEKPNTDIEIGDTVQRVDETELKIYNIFHSGNTMKLYLKLDVIP